MIYIVLIPLLLIVIGATSLWYVHKSAGKTSKDTDHLSKKPEPELSSVPDRIEDKSADSGLHSGAKSIGPESIRRQTDSGTILIEKRSGIKHSQQKRGEGVLRYVGRSGHPAVIPVSIQMGQTFTIGRLDVRKGFKQSDFEFAPQTEAVSRKHAAITRNENGYFIMDLGSKAGTYVKGTMLRTNQWQRLENSCTVSFGTRGADYIWEEF